MTADIRVLVVDDDPMQLELVERALSRDGFDVRTVGSIAELVTAAAGFSPEIVMVDVNLPDASPDRAIAIARDVANDAHVVLYSAWEDSKLRSLALRSGADAFISKSESAVAIGQRLRDLRRG